MTQPSAPPSDVVSPKALRVRLALIVVIAAVVGLTVGLIRGPLDGLVALIGTGLAGACFLLLFQPATESRGHRKNSAAIGFGSATGRGEDRKLNRAERRAQEREARRLAKRAGKKDAG